MSKESPETVEAGTVLAGRYRVVRQLGKGGMGSVYLVQHIHTDQQLALKVLHSTVVTDELALTRFRREARAPARVNSDHVVQVTDADVAPELGGVPFLVMEWLRGQDLEELSAERGPLPPEEVVLYLRHAARALDKAHALGIVHRDLKPENLFLTTREDGTPLVKILDFGIAKLNESSEEAGRFKSTGTGQIFGTPLYMSPEQTKAETDKVGPQSDIWALGIIAHRLLTGVEPWTATTLTALISQIAFAPMPVPSQSGHDHGPGFDAWFARCCAREPGERFPTAGEAVASLSRALHVAEDSGMSLSRPSSPSAIIRPSRDEIDRTAFSATAPAPLSISGPTQKSAELPQPGPSYRPLIAGGVAAFALAVGAFAYFTGRTPPPAEAITPPDSTGTHAAIGAGTTTATATAIVTPGSAASPEPTTPSPSTSTAADPKRPPPHGTADKGTSVHPVKTADPAPTAHPTATAVVQAPPPPPPPPDDPLGTRH